MGRQISIFLENFLVQYVLFKGWFKLTILNFEKTCAEMHVKELQSFVWNKK